MALFGSLKGIVQLNLGSVSTFQVGGWVLGGGAWLGGGWRVVARLCPALLC